MLPVQEADILHGGHDLPRHQAAADAVVRGRPPDRNGEERDFLGRAGAPSRGQAADRLDHEAQDHGGDGAARGRHAAVGAGGDGRCLPRRRARRRGKRGRGAPGKTPFVAAVSTSPEGRPRKVKLVPVNGFRKREIARGAKRWLAPGSEVLTDGLRCWNALDGVVGSHRAIRTGSGRQAARMAPFKWVNTTLGNIKSAITGTYRKARPRSCPTLPRQLRLAIQPALPAQHHDPALRSQRRTNPTHPIPSAHRWMTFMDKQECKRGSLHGIGDRLTLLPARNLSTTLRQ